MVPRSGNRAGGGREPAEGVTAARRAAALGPADRGWLARVAGLPGLLLDQARALADGAADASLELGRSWLLRPDEVAALPPERRTRMQEAGLYVRELRELTGLTLGELSDALEIGDRSLLAGVERGTATLSFELILRLSAVVARHDPVPFVLRMVRTYHPPLWQRLERWGPARIPLQFERERQFLNIYRSSDLARTLDDDEFAEVLRFTRSAFEMSLRMVRPTSGSDDDV